MNKQSIALLLRALQLRNDNNTDVATTDVAATAGEWNSADTNGLIALLEFEGATLWLYRRIQQAKVPVPDTIKAELRSAVTRSAVLNMRIDEQTLAVTQRLRANNFAVSLLKGQARRAAATLYPFADARTVSDVDLLVPEAEADRAWQLLLANGFRRAIEGDVDWKADHHRPTLIDASNVSVELHTTTSMSVPPAEAWRRATENCDNVAWNGVTMTVPNATELVWQALAHGAADGTKGFTLKGFLSVASVLAARPSIDWSVIASRLGMGEVLSNENGRPVTEERVRQYLDIAARLAGSPVPASLAPASPVNLAPLLLWRSQVLANSKSRAARERLIEESTRVEAGLPLTPFVKRVGLIRNARRRSASIGARIAYRVWRIL